MSSAIAAAGCTRTTTAGQAIAATGRRRIARTNASSAARKKWPTGRRLYCLADAAAGRDDSDPETQRTAAGCAMSVPFCGARLLRGTAKVESRESAGGSRTYIKQCTPMPSADASRFTCELLSPSEAATVAGGRGCGALTVGAAPIRSRSMSERLDGALTT